MIVTKENFEQVRVEMKAFADKWGLEFIYIQHVPNPKVGTVTEMKIGVVMTEQRDPQPPDGPAAAQEAQST